MKPIKLTIFSTDEYNKFKALKCAGGATHFVKVTEDIIGYYIIFLKPRNIIEKLKCEKMIAKSEFTFAT